MSFRHVVLLQFVEDAPGEARRAVVERLRELPAQIPEIESYDVRPDAGLEHGTHHVAVVADFADEGAFLVYQRHPAHQAVVREHIRPILAGRAAVQSTPG